jgi:hypothetical protein
MGKNKVQLPTFLERNNSAKQTKGQKERKKKRKKEKEVRWVTDLPNGFFSIG